MKEEIRRRIVSGRKAFGKVKDLTTAKSNQDLRNALRLLTAAKREQSGKKKKRTWKALKCYSVFRTIVEKIKIKLTIRSD